MTLYDPMKASGLPQSEWPVAHDANYIAGWSGPKRPIRTAVWMLFGGRIISEQQAADLCECALRRGIRRIVQYERATIVMTGQSDVRVQRWTAGCLNQQGERALGVLASVRRKGAAQ